MTSVSENKKLVVLKTPGKLSSISAWTYRKLAKPILFMIKPDNAHELMIASSSIVQKISPIISLLHYAWGYEDVTLTQEIDGIVFTNPMGLSAGLDKNASALGIMRATGFGYETCGSVSFRQCDGNPHPWFRRLIKSKSLIVHAGLPNDGINVILPRIRAYPDYYFQKFALVMSVVKTNCKECATDEGGIEDYLGTMKLIKDEPRISVIEINISCPNAYGGEPFTDSVRLEKLLSAAEPLNIRKPVWIKMPLNLPWNDFDALMKVVVNHPWVRGVTLANLNKDRKNAPLKEPVPSDDILGNLSGMPTQHLSNELIRRTYQAYGDKVYIIGVGGTFCAEDAYRKIRLGASLVDMITGLIFEGPQVVGTINAGLAELLARDGFSSIEQAVGADNGGFKRPPSLKK